MTYTKDEYGGIINGAGTYEQAAMDLVERGHVVLNWVDGRGSLLNILLSYGATRVGEPGGLIDSSGPKLWVGVAGMGATAYSLGRGPLAPDYIAEKLRIHSWTAVPVAELLSGIREQLINLEMGAQHAGA